MTRPRASKVATFLRVNVINGLIHLRFMFHAQASAFEGWNLEYCRFRSNRFIFVNERRQIRARLAEVATLLYTRHEF